MGAMNVNTASEAVLRTLSGVDAVRSAAIIAGRPWLRVADLAQIDGISAAMVETWADSPGLTVGAVVCAFADDEPGEDGFARVARMHHQPAQIDAATRAQGVVCLPGQPPQVKDGWRVSLWINRETRATEWRVEIDRDYREPAAEYLMRLPVLTRVRARERAETDPVMAELLRTLDMMVQDSAARGIHPGGGASRDALGYLVSVGLLEQSVADAILSPTR